MNNLLWAAVTGDVVDDTGQSVGTVALVAPLERHAQRSGRQLHLAFLLLPPVVVERYKPRICNLHSLHTVVNEFKTACALHRVSPAKQYSREWVYSIQHGMMSATSHHLFRDKSSPGL